MSLITVAKEEAVDAIGFKRYPVTRVWWDEKQYGGDVAKEKRSIKTQNRELQRRQLERMTIQPKDELTHESNMKETKPTDVSEDIASIKAVACLDDPSDESSDVVTIGDTRRLGGYV
ncbi:Hypothetical protein D9617_165g092330 [Elsinoe fawcettii]|nr:Hypothetical protein D9617_165g092330 [Elsinoe fawcettii]